MGDAAAIINDNLPPKGEYEEISDDERRIFLDEVDILCKKSINIYSFLLDQIHKHKMPQLPPAPGVASTVNLDGNRVIYEKDEDENNKPS